MPNWTSYDEIALVYEKVGAQNSSRVARDLIALVDTGAAARILDLGAGTGVASLAAREKLPVAFIVGCDVSIGMLRVGAQVRPGWHPVAASALQLPFGDETFDLVIANFVLSHLSKYREALAEVRRRLRPAGCIAASAWAAGSSGPGQRWQQLAVEFSSPQFVADAIAEVIPSEGMFSDRNTFEQILRSVGFLSVEVASRTYSYRWPLEEYLQDREATAVGRRLQNMLAPAQWVDFHAKTRRILAEEFGLFVEYSRAVLLATGEAP